ncbi:MAG: hypothetical protein ACTIBG_08800 [Brevibacterium aurantiacum]|uniref:hypothetical protein n=1 Tax=Brevibacterium aurantiacum TaxID=273384 RepID=UPI003F8FA2DC
MAEVQGESTALPQFKCVPISEDHFLMDFDCGRGSELTDWLCSKALTYHNERLCTVWLLVTDDQKESVRGYFTLSSHTIMMKEVGKRHRVDESSNGNIVSSLPQLPASLLGKFAIDHSLHGRGIGDLLMMNVFSKFVDAGRAAGSKYLVLEARERGLVDYYKSKFGFAESPNVDSDGLFRMYKRARDVEEDLEDLNSLLNC